MIKAKSKEGEVVLEAMGEGNVLHRIGAADVVKVDGMNIDRIAEIYNFDEDGNDVTVTKKRRGRKPKQKVEEEEID